MNAHAFFASNRRILCNASLVFLATLLPAAASWGQECPIPPQSRELIEGLGNQFMQRPESVGLSIGVLVDGQPNFFNFGTIARGGSDPPDENTIYEIGSISKTMTGTLLAQAVVDKQLHLDDDVRQYLDGDYPNLEFAGQPIRIKHLLNHTSGLPFQLPFQPDDFQNLSADDSRKLHRTQEQYTVHNLFDELHKIELTAAPGKNLSYSNTAAQLLGYVLERVCTADFDELLERNIVRPLAMQRTGVAFDAATQNRAHGYNASGDEMPNIPKSLAAAGAVSSTTSDLLKYAQLHLDERNPVVALTHQPTWGDVEYYAIGINWQMEKKPNLPHRIWQSGGTGGFSSLLVIYPQSKLAIVLLANESDENSQGVLSDMAKEFHRVLSTAPNSSRAAARSNGSGPAVP